LVMASHSQFANLRLAAGGENLKRTTMTITVAGMMVVGTMVGGMMVVGTMVAG
jgi:hypothetical protein